MRVDPIGWIATLGLVTVLVPGCGLSGASDASAPVERSPEYGPESWRELIAPDCQSFFDGCNQCQREPGAQVAACTRKACARYEAPRCLDD